MSAINQFRQLKAPDGASNVNFTQLGLSAATRSVEEKLRERVSVKDFGAVGDGSADDTAAVQAAINANPGRAIFFPAGEYRITSTLTISDNLTWLVGEHAGRGWAVAGSGGSVIICNAATDAVVFQNSNSPAGSLHGCGIRDLSIFRTADVASGAGLKLVDTTYFIADNLDVEEFFTCVQMVNAQSTRFDQLTCYTGNYFTYRANSALVKVSGYVASPTGDQVGWINSISQGLLTSNRTSDYGIYIESTDDFRLSDTYVGYLRTAGLWMQYSGVSAPMYTVNVDQTYFDGVTVDDSQTIYGVRLANDGATQTTAGALDIKFTGCTFAQHTVNVYGDEVHTATVAFTGCHFHNSKQHSVRIGNGNGAWAFTGCHWYKPGYDNIGNNWSAIFCEGAISLSVAGGAVNNILDNTRVFAFSGTTAQVNVQGVALNGVPTFAFTDLYTVGATITRLRFNVVSSATFPSVPFQGSFVPTLNFGGGSTGITYAQQIGRYTRQDNLVTAWISIVLTNKGSSTGNISIAGLPFTSTSQVTASGSAVLLSLTSGSLDFGAQCFVNSSSSDMWLYKGSATGHVRMTDADLTNTSAFYLTISYIV